MFSKLSVRCFAKINLQLHVGRRRSDGFHELATIFQSIDLHDSLELRPGGSGVRMRCDPPGLPCDESNLVVRAARAFERLSGKRLDLELALHKRIPVAAGLGGGSSDAAATLRALDLLCRDPLGSDVLAGAAAELGSDVPYFLVGGTALGRGRGEVLTPLEPPPPMHILLLAPPLQISSAEAYEHFDLTIGPDISDSTHRLSTGEDPSPNAPWYNDLEGSVFATHPELASLKHALLEAGAVDAVMSGSGPVIAGRFEDKKTAKRAASELRERGVLIVACSSLNADDFSRKFVIELEGTAGGTGALV